MEELLAQMSGQAGEQSWGEEKQESAEQHAARMVLEEASRRRWAEDELKLRRKGDIKKLKGFKNKYRLRAGNYRVLFELEGTGLVVYDVGDRKDIYE